MKIFSQLQTEVIYTAVVMEMQRSVWLMDGGQITNRLCSLGRKREPGDWRPERGCHSKDDFIHISKKTLTHTHTYTHTHTHTHIQLWKFKGFHIEDVHEQCLVNFIINALVEIAFIIAKWSDKWLEFLLKNTLRIWLFFII